MPRSSVLTRPCTPWQVRNLRSCIKVALDFVSPESLSQLEQLARDRRALALQETGPPDQKCVWLLSAQS